MTVFAMSSMAFVSADYDKRNHEGVMQAIEAGDYILLSDDAKEKISEEDFAEKVEHFESTQEHKDAIQVAITSNDYEAFKAEVEAHHEEREDRREEFCEKGDD